MNKMYGDYQVKCGKFYVSDVDCEFLKEWNVYSLRLSLGDHDYLNLDLAKEVAKTINGKIIKIVINSDEEVLEVEVSNE